MLDRREDSPLILNPSPDRTQHANPLPPTHSLPTVRLTHISCDACSASFLRAEIGIAIVDRAPLPFPVMINSLKRAQRSAQHAWKWPVANPCNLSPREGGVTHASRNSSKEHCNSENSGDSQPLCQLSSDRTENLGDD